MLGNRILHCFKNVILADIQKAIKIKIIKTINKENKYKSKMFIYYIMPSLLIKVIVLFLELPTE